MKLKPLNLIDFYKVDHRRQYPKLTNKIYANLTARSSKYAPWMEYEKTVFYGLQYFIKDYLIDLWNEEFFKKDIDLIIEDYDSLLKNSLGLDSNMSHWRRLHKLGYLPLEIKALPEGSLVNIGVPYLTITNTHPEFFWLVNYIETLLSSVLWRPITSATIAKNYKNICEAAADRTCDNKDHLPFQCHDFSFRGLANPYDAALSGSAHLLSFMGTDSVPAIDLAQQYYNAGGGVGVSVPATEHSVMGMGEKDSEIETFKRLITELYPNGIVSIVSDTWDLWKVLTKYLPELHDEVIARDGKVVIRPDSGDPVDIICGVDGLKCPITGLRNAECKGVVELLWDEFGGTTNSKGYKVLDSRVGVIYGDSITMERATQIFERLEDKGFASSNIVFGVGSYTYQYQTRDTFGLAMKTTYGEVSGVGKSIYKDPVTDDGIKKSARGLLKVSYDKGDFILHQDVTEEEEKTGELKTVFKDSKLLIENSFHTIKSML